MEYAKKIFKKSFIHFLQNNFNVHISALLIY